MSESDVLMLKGELHTLKAVMEEKWASHDKRADERWTDLMDKMHEVQSRKTPCEAHIKLMEELNGRVKATEKWIDMAGWAIGVVYVAVVGTMVKIFWG